MMNDSIVLMDKDLAGYYRLEKSISLKSLAEHLSIMRVDMGFALPYGTVAVRYSKDVAETLHLVVLRDRRKGPIYYSEVKNSKTVSDFINMDFPPLCFVLNYKMDAEVVERCEVYMLSEDEGVSILPGMTKMLYRAPFPNQYEDHNFCLGSAAPKTPAQLIEYFYESEFNSDLISVALKAIHPDLHDMFNDGMTVEEVITVGLKSFNEQRPEPVKKLTIPNKIFDSGGGEWNLIQSL